MHNITFITIKALQTFYRGLWRETSRLSWNRCVFLHPPFSGPYSLHARGSWALWRTQDRLEGSMLTLLYCWRGIRRQSVSKRRSERRILEAILNLESVGVRMNVDEWRISNSIRIKLFVSLKFYHLFVIFLLVTSIRN